MQSKDDLPAQPVHMNGTAEQVSQNQNINQKSDSLSPQRAPERPDGSNTTTPDVNYDSNPFSITFTNFSKMFKHAQAVAIIMVVFGVLGSFGNIPNFDSSTLDELRNDDSSLFEQTTSQTAQVSVAQNQDTRQELIDGVNLSLENTTTTDEAIDESAGAVAVIILIILIAMFAFLIVALAIGAIWSGLVAASANMAVRDRDISFGNAFSQSMSRFGTMFVALFIAGLKTIGGYLLLIVPGIRAQARYAALPYVVMGNPSMGATQAVNETKKLYNGHLLESFSITWVGGIIPFVGDILSAVGLAQSARQISDYKSKGLPKPPMSGWNWVAPIVVGVFLAIVAVVLVVVFVAVANS